MHREVRKIGVLALQGAFQKHLDMLHTLNVEGVAIRSANQCAKVDGIIIPGGESTTISSMLEGFCFDKPLFGTCAGLIIMQKLGLIDISVQRNGYGRQKDSFSTTINFLGKRSALFIRAPLVESVSSQVEVLARLEETPVLIRQKNRLACSFHPELTDDTTIHRYFLESCFENS
ncbi:MAG: pyridoxal 5'-phosphate synthase glutaminase subunit PdxT [Chlamydiales bacterium]